MQRIIVEVGSKNVNIGICYEKESKHILTIPIEFEKNYRNEGRLDTKDIDKLIERINILNVVYYDIHVYGTGIFRELKNEEKEKFLEEFKEKTKRDFLILSEEEENKLHEKGVEYLAYKDE